MKESELLQLVRSDISNSTGKYFQEINEQRADAIRAYNQELYGNEEEGRSQVVTSEVADTIESFMPSLMKVFTAGGRVCDFTAMTPEDEEAVRQETDYVNHAFYEKQNGFGILYSWFKSALLQKNGFVKVYYDDREQSVVENYTGLSQEDADAMISDENIELLEYEEESDGIELQLRRTYDMSIPKVENIPPEEFLIHPEYEHMSLNEIPFCAHQTVKTASDLIAEGFPKAKVDKLAAYSEEYNPEKQARLDEIGGRVDEDSDGRDTSMREIQVSDCYKLVDFNGDGIAELRRIVLGNETEVLLNEETDVRPFVSITPVPVPNRFFGRSIADQTMDLQLQKTTLLRNILDNLYLINNQEKIVLDGGADLDDLMTSRPGGIKREYVPNAIRLMPTQAFTGQPYNMLEYLDGMKETRTGITKYNQGLDANSLNKTATGITKVMDASQQRTELVARLFAVGVANMMLLIHKILLQNRNMEDLVKLNGTWVPVNPAEWRDRTSMTINVGLGTSDDEVMIQRLKGILDMQVAAMAQGAATPEHMWNTVSRLIWAAGLRNPELYFSTPNQIAEAQKRMEEAKAQSPQDPQMAAIKMQSDALAAETQQKREESQSKQQLEAQKAEANFELQTAQSEAKHQIEMRKLEEEQRQFDNRLAKDYDEMALKHMTPNPEDASSASETNYGGNNSAQGVDA